MILTNARIYNSEAKKFDLGSIEIENGIIKNILSGEKAVMKGDKDMNGAMLIPGFVDAHTHGRNGYDFNTATVENMKEMAKAYLSKGVTTVMPTLASAPIDKLAEASDSINALKNGDGKGARYAGVHLEGRYLNVSKRGAHASDLIAPLDANELKELISHMKTPCHISAALELDKDGSFMKTALDMGATLGLGHTSATCAEALDIYKRGNVSMTHTYNAMTPLHHREAGVVGAALLSDAYCELICDGLHICPEIVALTYKVKGSDRVVLITDSMEATGHGDGEYSIAGMPVIVKDGKALTIDGALAGSTLELADGVRNLVRFAGASLEEAIACATINPAKMLNIDNVCGSLEVGKYADILVAHEDDDCIFVIDEVLLGGERA